MAGVTCEADYMPIWKDEMSSIVRRYTSFACSELWSGRICVDVLEYGLKTTVLGRRGDGSRLLRETHSEGCVSCCGGLWQARLEGGLYWVDDPFRVLLLA